MSGQPPPPTRFITTNDAHGKGFISQAHSPTLSISKDLGGSTQRLVYTTDSAPIELTKDADLNAYTKSVEQHEALDLVRSDGGTNVWYLDVPPGAESPLHRTVTVDYIIVVQGQIELTLDGGESRLVKAGDIVVQRSTMHKWKNLSKTEWVRMVSVMVPCEDVVTEDGKRLDMEFL